MTRHTCLRAWPKVAGRTSLRVALGLLLLAPVAGCAREPAAPPERYRVRALVRQLPAPGAPRGEIYVRHEALPSFMDADGKVVGMDSMSMPFPLADVGLVAGLEVGDRIEMDFEVNWRGGNPLAVTAVEKLPAGTRLAFETATPDPEPAAAEPGAAAEAPPAP